jgi:hypothetical protein
MRECLKSRLVQVGIGLFVFGRGPLLFIIGAAAVGLWPNPHPNPIGPGPWRSSRFGRVSSVSLSALLASGGHVVSARPNHSAIAMTFRLHQAKAVLAQVV